MKNSTPLLHSYKADAISGMNFLSLQPLSKEYSIYIMSIVYMIKEADNIKALTNIVKHAKIKLVVHIQFYTKERRMNMSKRILLLVCLLTVLSCLNISAYADSDIQSAPNLQINGDNPGIVDPMYIPHECHTGPQHENCKYVSKDLDCGCFTHAFYCCCGKLMYMEKYLCSKHQY